MSIKIEHEDIPQDPEEPDVPSLRRSHTEQSAETAVLPQDKGAVSQGYRFRQIGGGGSRSADHQDEIPILPTSTEKIDIVQDEDTVQDEDESELIGNGHLLKILCELESIRTLRGVNSRG